MLRGCSPKDGRSARASEGVTKKLDGALRLYSCSEGAPKEIDRAPGLQKYLEGTFNSIRSYDMTRGGSVKEGRSPQASKGVTDEMGDAPRVHIFADHKL